jgi:uncharacterized protein with FMN-binding domain
LNSSIKLITIGTIIVTALVGCSSQKGVLNDIEDKNSQTEISQTAPDNKEENESSNKEGAPVTEKQEEEKKDMNKEVSVSKEQSQPVTQNTGTSGNKVNQAAPTPSPAAIPNAQDDKKATPESPKPTPTPAPNPQDVKKEEPKQQPTETKKYQDGVYKGAGMGFEDMINVKVTVVDGKINSISVLSHDDTPRIANRAFELLTTNIISSQKLDVDTISGATYSSKGFIEAVKKSLSK